MLDRQGFETFSGRFFFKLVNAIYFENRIPITKMQCCTSIGPLLLRLVALGERGTKGVRHARASVSLMTTTRAPKICRPDGGGGGGGGSATWSAGRTRRSHATKAATELNVNWPGGGLAVPRVYRFLSFIYLLFLFCFIFHFIFFFFFISNVIVAARRRCPTM